MRLAAAPAGLALFPALFLALALVLAPALLPGAAAQPPAVTQGYQARVGLGDLPTTPAVEPAGWNVVQAVRVAHANGTEDAVRFPLPPGTAFAACTCGPVAAQPEGGSMAVRVPASVSSGDVEVTLTTSAGPAAAFAAALTPPAGRAGDAVVIVFLPAGHAVDAAVAPDAPSLPCTQADCSILTYTGTAARPLPQPMWIGVHPGTPAAQPLPVDPNPTTRWLYPALAFAAGCIAWALLVRQGVVQKRTRRQTVAAAAHQEIAAREPAALLEGKKRALMAALKEVEVARMNQEMDAPTYDAVKAEFKRQAVTVMRALESSEGKREGG